MSLLLDALKKSEAQRRRGKAPAIDLTSASPSGGSRRPGLRWWIVLLAIALLVVVAVVLWPRIAAWTERGQTAGMESGSGADTAGPPENAPSGPTGGVASPSPAPPESSTPGATPAQAAGTRRASRPAAVAGAANERRIARADDAPDARTDSASTAGQQSARMEENGGPAATEAGPASTRQPERAGQVDRDEAADDAGEAAQAERAEQAEQAAGGSRPSRNFIHPWELPQAQRAEFPDLKLTVHFFAEQPGNRFVVINGERYSEGEQAGTGVRLVEIRRRGAVVEFGSYRVLIE